MLAVLVFIIILGVLIFVHELGHFVMARRNGIKASEFGFGFPPRIFGVQRITGEENKKEMEVKSVEVKSIDIKSQGQKIREEIITERLEETQRLKPVRKWRIIWGSRDGDDENEKKDLNEAHEKRFQGGTIYSINWIPLGGFVKIKGEDGGNISDEDSFAGKSAWVRTKVLAAGVMMNFVLAWVLISIVFMLGAPQAFDPAEKNVAGAKIQISEIVEDSPAQLAGINIGDEISKKQVNPAGESVKLSSVEDVQNYIKNNAGKELNLGIIRGDQTLAIKITPRVNAPEGQGLLGVNLAQTKIIKYSWYKAFWEGLKSTYEITLAILVALGGIIKNLFMGNGVGADVAGPVGIAVLTKQVTGLGLVYILQFAALLSINLGIINILPIPALDGGRILFVLIEKMKGSPVSQKLEQTFHSVGFLLLILLLILVTFKDVMKFVR
ncbi:MAG: RIP metalloprotease RseP [Candidatus Moranbacteria bacterium CG23_combo_of_CG06-09_8_20_14_all_35_22]|nr:MAG: RIP metalloprotease RseP [Candidatus Moranbacteria bacterium CG23_combo_of_CG06-09_8_20_14_all_35_22]